MLRRPRLDLLAILALAVLVAAFFWPLFTGRYRIPHGGGDLASFLWPTWRFAAAALRQGTLPLWNPTLYAGMPFAADNQSALFYPINLVAFLLFGEPGYRTMEALVVLHMILAGALMFLLLRDQRLSRCAALFGGLAFALSDLFVTHIGNLNLSATIAYLPGLVLLADRAFTRRSPGWAAAAGALLAVSALAGHGQMLLFLGLALALLALYRAALAGSDGLAGVARVLGLAGLMAIVGCAGAAVALYPSYELTAHSLRGGGLSLEEASRYSLPWRALVGLAVPRFYGRGPAAFWGPWERVEIGYLGLLPLVLGLAALLPRGRGEEDRSFPTVYLALVALCGLALALGERTPLYRLAHGLPLLGSMRAPARLIVLTDFGLAALAAYALDRLPHSRRLRAVALIGLLLAVALALALPRAVAVPTERLAGAQKAVRYAIALGAVGLLWLLAVSRRPALEWLRAGAVLILALDLIVSGSTAEIDPGDPGQGYRHDDVVAWLQSDPDLFRIDSTAASAWQPDAAAVHGLYDIGGLSNPLGLAAYETYRWSISGRGDTLHSLLAVRYALADKGSPPGDERLVPVFAGQAVDVYRNTNAYPLAQLVYEAVQVDGAREAFDAIHAEGFDPARTIILQEAPQPLAHPGDRPHSVTWTEYATNRLALHVETPTPAYLLLSEVHYPGWRATVDGRPTAVLVADYLFRALYIPAGRHEVRLWFSPPSFWAGLGLSLTTWLGLGAWGATAAWRRRAARAGLARPQTRTQE